MWSAYTSIIPLLIMQPRPPTLRITLLFQILFQPHPKLVLLSSKRNLSEPNQKLSMQNLTNRPLITFKLILLKISNAHSWALIMIIDKTFCTHCQKNMLLHTMMNSWNRKGEGKIQKFVVTTTQPKVNIFYWKVLATRITGTHENTQLELPGSE